MNAPRLPIVELAPAYVWDCEACGRENFQRSVTRRLDPRDPVDAADIRAMLGLDPDEPIDDLINDLRRVTAHTRPERVTCRHCNAEFRAVDSGEPLPDGPDDEEDTADA